jgi:hypothetical protein
MNKPTFIIVGAAKAGTTSLYQYLSQHPEISFSAEKEPHYFVREQKFSFPIVAKKAEYIDLFSGALSKEVGEASTGYLYFSGTAKRIKDELPNAKIIMVLRSPIAIALSMWGHQVREGLELSSFEEAVDQEISAGKRSVNGVEYGFNYIQQARIDDQVAEYLDIFDRDNVFIADFQELVTDASAVVKKLYAFLDVDVDFEANLGHQFNPSGIPKFSRLHSLLNNKGTWRRILTAPLRILLTEEQRHALWAKIRDKNITEGSAHTISDEARDKLEVLLQEEQQAMQGYLQKQR